MTDVEIIRGESIKQGDTLPNLRVKLLENGDPFNLSDYSVSMRMKRSDADSLIVDDAVTVEKASRGIVTYEWSQDETDTEGTYLIEFVADNNSGDSITFPNSGTAKFYIDGHL